MTRARRRILVTGRDGQVVRSLRERGSLRSEFEIVAAGRPELDLARPDTIASVMAGLRPDLVVSAAAYTAVDRAEQEEDVATLVNAAAPGEVAKAAATLGVPIVHLSTDYVFDGTKPAPYVESDAAAPLGAYGRSKLLGEAAVARETANHAILRTAWLYGPFGHNFLKTMLRLAQDRDGVGVVGDQCGNPTSTLDLADAILAIAQNLMDDDDPAMRGVFHVTAGGNASWADFAEEIFRCSRLSGGPFAMVERITTAQYPTPAARPANSRLDCTKVLERHGVRLPHWRASVPSAVEACLGARTATRSE